MKAKYKNIVSVLTISTGFTVLFLINGHRYFLTIAVLLSIVSLLSPYLAEKISMAWLWLGKMLGYVTNTIILTVLFYLILTPLALISNRKRRKSFFLDKAPENSSFTERNYTFGAKDMENVW